MSKEKKNKSKKAISEICLLGYQTTVSLFLEEEGRLWDRFNVMLVANSIILASTYVISNSNLLLKILTCILGFLICLIWYFMMFRSIAYRDFYIEKAKEIESKYLEPYIDTIKMGGDFAEGKDIKLKIGEKINRKKISSKAKLLRGSLAIYIVITLFIIMYLLIILN